MSLKTIEIFGYKTVVKIPKIGKLDARIDTGATTSSIHADNIKIKNEIVTFDHNGTELSFPLVGTKTIRNANGSRESYIVRMKVSVNGIIKNIKVSLADRSNMTYPFILGRNALKNTIIHPAN